MRTSLYSILCIAIRVGALWLGFQTLLLMASGIRIASADGNPAALGMAILSATSGFALTAMLWLWPGVIARLAVRNAALEVFESPIAASEIQYIAISVLGVVFAFDGVVRLIHEVLIAIGVGALHTDASFGQIIKRELMDIITSASRVVLGGGLLLGAHGLVGWLRTMRERGLPPAWPDSASEEGHSPAD